MRLARNEIEIRGLRAACRAQLDTATQPRDTKTDGEKGGCVNKIGAATKTRRKNPISAATNRHRRDKAGI